MLGSSSGYLHRGFAQGRSSGRERNRGKTVTIPSIVERSCVPSSRFFRPLKTLRAEETKRSFGNGIASEAAELTARQIRGLPPNPKLTRSRDRFHPFRRVLPSPDVDSSKTPSSWTRSFLSAELPVCSRCWYPQDYLFSDF